MRFLSFISAKLVIASALLGVFVLASGAARAGDSAYGTVVAVNGPDLVTMEVGKTRVEVQIVGVVVPREGRAAEAARKLVAEMVLNQHARFRFDHRTPEGVMVSRLYTDSPKFGIKEVGIELLRQGLARRDPAFEGKYGEFAAAESEAQRAKRGLWATTRPQP